MSPAGTSTITVQLRDAQGNDLTTSGGVVVINANNGTMSTTTDVGDGTYTAVLSAAPIGVVNITVTLDGITLAAPASVTVTAELWSEAARLMTAAPRIFPLAPTTPRPLA
jgi:adhesin/invasin